MPGQPSFPAFAVRLIALAPVGAVCRIPAQELLREIDQVQPPKVSWIDDPIGLLNDDIAPDRSSRGIARCCGDRPELPL
jgi:hypothetical protein